MRKHVTYPKHIFKGITPNHRAYPRDANLRLFALDTETEHGRPMTVQGHDGVETLFCYVDERSCFDTLMRWVWPRLRSHGTNIAYIHYLKFDLPVVFFERRVDIYEQIAEIEFRHHGYDCKLLFGKVNKAEVWKGDKKLTIYDSWAFTHGSLARSLEQFKVPYSKHDKPAGLGKIRYDWACVRPELREEFEGYGRADVVSLWHLARRIMDFHEQYQVRPCISLPQFGTRVLRHHFFRKGECMAFPPVSHLRGCELAYHGGKNHIDPSYITRVVEGVYEADISSAYPHAMTEIPQLVKGSYVKADDYVPGVVGVYKVSGHDVGQHPLVYDDDFRPVHGAFKDLWLTSYELEAGRESPDVELAISDGLVWLPEEGYDHNPVAEYIRHFYELRAKTPKSDPNNELYKLLMNAISGKWIQAVEVRKIVDTRAAGALKKLALDFEYDPVLKKFIRLSNEFRAGGMYHPFMAALVTGHCRARIFREERRYGSIHTATDAIKTLKPVEPKKGLGGFKLETHGRCYFFRNKLYLHFCDDPAVCGHDMTLKDPTRLPPRYPKDWPVKALRGQPMLDHDGQHLCKIAHHGFKGTVQELFENRDRIIEQGFYSYEYDHMVGLREGLRGGMMPCSMWNNKPEVLRLR